MFCESGLHLSFPGFTFHSYGNPTFTSHVLPPQEQREGKKVDEVEEVKMYAMFIEKMDSSISSLCHCT